MADKKYVAEQLAARHEFIDINKVGIFGHSGGGFMSTAAMLVYPDFYKVAVSSAGNHNNPFTIVVGELPRNRKDENENGELSINMKLYNQELAKNLKGHLLL